MRFYFTKKYINLKIVSKLSTKEKQLFWYKNDKLNKTCLSKNKSKFQNNNNSLKIKD